MIYRVIATVYFLIVSSISLNSADIGSQIITTVIESSEQMVRSYNKLKDERDRLRLQIEDGKKVKDIAWFMKQGSKIEESLRLIDEVFCLVDRFQFLRGEHERTIGNSGCYWDIKIKVVESSLSANITLLTSTITDITGQLNSIQRAEGYSSSMNNLKRVINDLQISIEEMETDLEIVELSDKETEILIGEMQTYISASLGLLPVPPTSNNKQRLEDEFFE